ncbi:uncharacterized protein TRIADDRAFT_22822 [Trichoplax adhaerens]|uniref:Glucosylceramidase n=1 Tax=Trichoplax adhaerens TaxID=10228 RepID=B3RRR4_TRIAD|nr:hypothetical protein TRIADDRAFT_22822 [Trichoplax adhaerens]EDV26916.1 hypothetical protein TRIADDRAFT_22822 [Trichoplax adhaerens]|eukprot:XP_002110912.1 hypothetical protein TRIADDRAFT_22822 [Trichoplax adhaerens]
MIWLKFNWLLASLFMVAVVSGSKPCWKKMMKNGVVCVCNSSYCDSSDPIDKVDNGKVIVIQSTSSGDRLVRKTVSTSNKPSNKKILTFRPDLKYQKIAGFGGAFTDSATMLINNVSARLRMQIMRSYYAKDGSRYTMGRVPIASTDFSTHRYTYDDNNNKPDFDLKNFSLAMEDLHYKIPIIKLANKIADKPLKLVATPWTAPAWMKTNNKLIGMGSLKGQAGDNYHTTWANYFVKFLDSYSKRGITFWGITAQNEPTDGNTPNFSFQCMGFKPDAERDFIKKDLGPTLAKHNYSHVNLIILDDNRPLLPEWAIKILKDKDARKYVKGIGIHWYLDVLVPVTVLNVTHYLFPDVFILATEACTGTSLFDTPGPLLGSWARGVRYSTSIIDDLNNFVVGWLDWNLVLDLKGGPNWVKNFADSPIIIDSKQDVIYKQPMFYHLAHFSKYINPGSVRVGIKGDTNNTKIVGVIDSGRGVVVILNPYVKNF